MAEPRISEEGVPIDHLDYGYVRNCKNVKEVEKILRVLRSRSEGYYPDLIRYTEEHLAKLCPTSKLLIKSSKAKRMSDLPSEESQQLNADLEQWRSEMSSKETRHENGPIEICGKFGQFGADDDDEADNSLPPIRTPGSISKEEADAATNNGVASGKSKRIASHDFQAWDRYDADKEAEKVDEDERRNRSSPVVSPRGIPIELSAKEKSMSSVDKEKAALREKNKGNEAYRSNDHQEALVYYTRSIKFHPTAAAFNNRAITEIKLGRHEEAISDCKEVLKLEPNNTKALFRRATAYTQTKEYRAAAEDLECVLQLEPNNKKVQEELNRLRRDHLEETVGEHKQPKRGKRIQIEESDGEDKDESDGEKEPVSVTTSTLGQSEEATDSPQEVMDSPQEVTDSLQGATDSPQEATDSLQGTMDSPQEVTDSPQEATDGPQGATDSPQEVTDGPQGATDSPQETTDGPQEATDGPQGATDSPQEVTDGPQGATNGPQEATDSPQEAFSASSAAQDESERGGIKVSRYSSNGPMSSPGTGAPITSSSLHPPEQQKKETTPLNTEQTAVPEQSIPAQQPDAPPPATVTVADVSKQDVVPTQVPSSTVAQQKKISPPPEVVLATNVSQESLIPGKQMQASQDQAVPPVEVQVAPPPEPPPELPPSVKKLKEEGNDLFRRGQYGEAVKRYSKGIKTLEKESKAHVPNISTLLNNRAACHLKNGNIRGCINDCTKSIELVPVNLKAFLRRAQSYEALEKYKDAYNDFHLALRIDGSVEAAYTACSRIARLLQDQEGFNWRSKLPPHKDGERVRAALAEHKYRSGSLGGLPLLSTVVNVEQSGDTTLVGGEATMDQRGGDTPDGGSAKLDQSDDVNVRSDGAGEESSDESTSGQRDSLVTETLKTVGGSTEGKVSVAGASFGGAMASEVTDSGRRERRKEDRKEAAGERVPEMPPVNVTATSTSGPQVTQTTQPVLSPHHSDAPPTGPSLSQLTPEQKFERLKAEGNEHVKKGEFVEALNCYSLCVNACPNRVVAYTNRALCHLKLKSPRSAEEDCSMALSFEPNNVKALYRRALARKALSKFLEATKDLKALLEFDPNNSVAQQELADVKQLWTKKLRELQQQQESVAKAAPGSQKTKSGKTGGSSKKKSGQRKSSKETVRTNQLAELQKKKNELERLLQVMAEEPKKQQQANPPSQMRKNELDKLLKEAKAKTKAAETKATETRGHEATRGPEMNGAAASRQTPPTATPTSTPTETQVEEKISDAVTKEKAESGDHLTSSKTANSKGKRKPKTEKYAKATPHESLDTSSNNKEAGRSSPSEVGKEEPANKSKWKKIIVEEGPESEDEEVAAEPMPAASNSHEGTGTSSTQHQAGACEAVKQTTTVPTTKTKERLASPYEFVQRWNSIPRTAQSIEYARLLEQIAPETLPEVITNKLDGMMLTNIIRAIDKQFVPKRQYKLSVDILLYLTKVPRFQMNAMFLGPIEKEDLKNVFTVLLEHRDEISVPAAMLETMQRSYGLDS